MVVLDTGSTDDTISIAREAGCLTIPVGNRFLHEVSEEEANAANAVNVLSGEPAIVTAGQRYFDFASARNFAASMSPTDFIAMPDCDEVYTTLDLDRIEDGIQHGVQQFSYPFVFAHLPDGRPGLQFIHSKFYDRRILEWKGIVHECLFPTGEPARCVTVGQDMIHLEHFQNPSTNRSQYMVGLAIGLLKVANDRNTHYLARELFYTGRYQSAIRLFQRHIEMNGWVPEQARSMIMIGDCYAELSDRIMRETNGTPTKESRSHDELSISWWTKSFSTFLSREPILRIATHYWKRDDKERAAVYAIASLQVQKPSVYFVMEREYGSYPHELLYWAFFYLGRIEEAKKHHDLALAFEPMNPKYIHDYKFFTA